MMGDGLLILYGSQTGQSEAVARMIEDHCVRVGVESRLFVLADCDTKFRIEREPLVVVVVSSTGDGDPPDNAAKFVRFITRRSHSENLLKDTEFALLGLGDSNYSTYQGVPRLIEKHLLRLGARKLVPTGVADDQIGLELGVEPWVRELFEVVVSRFGLPIDSLQKLFSDVCVSTQSKMSDSEDVSGNEESGEGDMSYEDEEEDEVKEVLLKPLPFHWPVDQPSLVRGGDSLRNDENLRVSVPPLTYIASTVSHLKFEDGDVEWQNGCQLPGAVGRMQRARVVGTAELTYPGAGKTKRELQIDLGDAPIEYEPGDALYFAVANPREEVNLILQRLNLLTVADQQCKVVVHPRTEKRNAAVPLHIPGLTSLRHLFTHCIDIRRTPGRPVLRVLADSATDDNEKRRLLELCSAQGNAEFTQFVRQAGLSLADVLFAFPSCRPPADRLIELLPRLMPRAYSVACSRQRSPRRVRLVYSMLRFEPVEGRRYARHGLACDWLASLRVGDTVQVVLKAPSRFRLPTPSNKEADPCKIPLIMIGPGTGVAPFLSFLQDILERSGGQAVAKVVRELYFGCRDVEVDSIYGDELRMYVREGVLSHLSVCQSRPAQETASTPKYVQGAIRARGKHVCDLLKREGEQRAVVYVCGDAKGMAKDVWNTFIAIIAQHHGKSLDEARAFLEQLKSNDRYIEDVWA